MKLQDFAPFKDKKYSGLNSFNLESLAYTLSQKLLAEGGCIKVVLPSLYEAQQLQSFLSDFVGDDDVKLFLCDEVLRVDALGSSREMMYERLKALSSLYGEKPGIVIFNAAVLLRPVVSRLTYDQCRKVYHPGEPFSRQEFLSGARAAGYVQRSRVEHPGEFAIRGLIVDFFNPAEYQPVRLELDGHRIEEIRAFDPALETSTAVIEEASLEVAADLLYRPAERDKIAADLLSSVDMLKDFDEQKVRITALAEAVQGGEDGLFVPYRHHRYFGDFCAVGECVDSFSAYHLPEVKGALERFVTADREYFSDLCRQGGGLSKDSLYRTEALQPALERLAPIAEREEEKITSVPYVFGSLLTFGATVKSIVEDGYRAVVFISQARRASLLARLAEEGIAWTLYPELSKLTIFDGSLSAGLIDQELKICYLGTKEIFGLANRSANFLTRFKEAKILRRYDDLKPGDYVVHEMHGIGRYDGVVVQEGLEYLKVVYQGGDRLLIPLAQFKLIKRYSGREGYAPALDKIGGSTWSRRKNRIRSKLAYLADQLLEVSSRRQLEAGFAFPDGQAMEEEFSAAFPYELTDSQKEAWKAIKNDMETPRPMDRLLSGDVGFGKTELAFRAAYKAILAGKQVALLCPTTVLCRQHYEVALQRFGEFGVRIACFSRFVPEKVQSEAIRELNAGRVQLAIGTHRLLADEIKFADLGLLIIDEEQRFGVVQKEKIKKIAGNIDVLTLTATPIPRTLQMSLLGVREFSNLGEPPLNRLPIKTYVTSYDEGLVKEAIELELGRRGQVYYLHNRVKTIDATAARLHRLFPHAAIGVVHGQMSAESISDVMNAFYDGEIDILACTTIIETGLDVGNVNTMIVEDADRFGLAQLYQIKGRVGRSERLAYAYLFYDPQKSISDDSRKRLKALKEFTELGSGYNIAKQDLNLRGAGDMLGAEQAGFVDTLGFDNYQALLNEVIKQKSLVAKAAVAQTDYTLSFSLDSHVPPEYAPEESRITIYRELAGLVEPPELDVFAKKLRDVYGPYPQEVYNLLCKKAIEMKLSRGGVRSFVEGMDHYELVLSLESSRGPRVASRLQDRLDPVKDLLRVYFKDGSFALRITKTREYLENLLFILNTIESLVEDQ